MRDSCGSTLRDNHSESSNPFLSSDTLVLKKTVEIFEHVLESMVGCVAAAAAWLDETGPPQSFQHGPQ